MLPAKIPSTDEFSAPLVQRDILLWTTKDGREIPLDEMSDDHIVNALRVLTLWKSRAKKRDAGDPIVRELGEAIDRFKRITRTRRKTAERAEPAMGKRPGFGRRMTKA